jgi:uncharacterized protein (TIGR00251 family)
MIDIQAHAEGCVLAVRAQPGARKAGVMGEQAGALKVAVTAPAQDGRANKALLEELRDALQLKRSQLELAGGETSRDKRVLIRGLNREELLLRLARLVDRKGSSILERSGPGKAGAGSN